MNTKTSLRSPAGFRVPAALALMSAFLATACGGSSSKGGSEEPKKETDALAKVTPKVSTPQKTTPGTQEAPGLSATQTQVPAPQGPTQVTSQGQVVNQNGQVVGQVGQIVGRVGQTIPSQQQGNGQAQGNINPSQQQQGSGSIQIPVQITAANLRFPVKIVGKPEEILNLQGGKLDEAQPVLTSDIRLGGRFIPAGSRVEGALQLKKGGASIFQAQVLHLSNGANYAIDGSSWIGSRDDNMTQANAIAIAAGAVVGGGLAALVDHFVGGGGVSPWIVAAGTVAGGVLGWQLFPDHQEVVIIDKDAASQIGVISK